MFHLSVPGLKAHALRFGPGGWLLAVGGGRFVRLAPGASRPIQPLLVRHDQPFAVSPGGTRLAVARIEAIDLFDLGADAPPVPVPCELRYFGGLAVADDGRLAAHPTASGRVLLLSPGQPRPRVIHLADWAAGVWFDPSGETVYVAFSEGWRTVEWETRQAGPVHDVIAVPPSGISPDGRWLVGGRGRWVRLWPVAGGDPLDLVRPGESVTGWAFTPDAARLLTSTVGGLVHVWELPTGRLADTFAPGLGRLLSVAVAADGLTAAAGGVGRVAVWDV